MDGHVPIPERLPVNRERSRSCRPSEPVEGARECPETLEGKNSEGLTDEKLEVTIEIEGDDA